MNAESGHEVFQRIKYALSANVVAMSEGNVMPLSFQSKSRNTFDILTGSFDQCDSENAQATNAPRHRIVWLEYSADDCTIHGAIGAEPVKIKLEVRNGELIFPTDDEDEFVAYVLLKLPTLL